MSLLIASEPLRVVVKPSRQAFCYVLVAHSFAFWAVLQAGLYIFLPLILLSLLFFWCNWRQSADLLFVLRGDECALECRGVSHLYLLGKRHLVCNFLVIVELKSPPQLLSRYIVIFGDAVDAETLRRLRVLLRFPLVPKAKIDNSLVPK